MRRTCLAGRLEVPLLSGLAEPAALRGVSGVTPLDGTSRDLISDKLTSFRRSSHTRRHRRARPPVDRMTIVELIAATTTTTGLKVACALDTRCYERRVQPGNHSPKVF